MDRRTSPRRINIKIIVLAPVSFLHGASELFYLATRTLYQFQLPFLDEREERALILQVRAGGVYRELGELPSYAFLVTPRRYRSWVVTEGEGGVGGRGGEARPTSSSHSQAGSGRGRLAIEERFAARFISSCSLFPRPVCALDPPREREGGRKGIGRERERGRQPALFGLRSALSPDRVAGFLEITVRRKLAKLAEYPRISCSRSNRFGVSEKPVYFEDF